MVETAVNPAILRYFEKRGIDPEVVLRMGVYSGRRTGNGGEVVADATGEVIVFPFFRGEQVASEKYRGAHKTFWQKPNGTKCFYNCNVLDDPLLKSGREALVITEGEMDALTAIHCGHPFTISVPDGAPAKRAQGEGDFDNKFSYVLEDWDRLKPIKKIIIATDGDEPGKILAEELVRRLGRVRCHWVTYPDGCKDLNDVLKLRDNPQDVLNVLKSAKPYPVSGLYRLSDYPAEPDLNPLTTGWGRLDDNLRVFYPALMVVVGFAGAGKSTWTTQLVAQLVARHNWAAAIASFEMRLKPFITDILRSVFLDKPKDTWSVEDYQESDAWIEHNYSFISPASDDDNHDLDWLIERAAAAVIRHGIRVLMIDPWNEIEHSRHKHENLTEYTGRAIRALKKFASDFDCLVIVVAHPTKEGARKSSSELSLYDVSDSAHFANKADLGVVISRVDGGDSGENYLTNVLVRKVRFQPETGKPGDVVLTYDPATRCFGQ